MTWKKVLFASVYFPLVMAVLLEIGVRVYGCSAHYIHDGIYHRDSGLPLLPYLIKPGLRGARGRGRTELSTDALGCRSLHPGETLGPKTARELRIAVFGDSVTFGEGVPDTADTYCQVLERELGRRFSGRQVRVFNFGVSGYSIRTMLDHAEGRAHLVQPDLILVAMIADDLNLNRTPGIDRWGHNAVVDPAHPEKSNSQVKHWLRQSHLAWALRDLSHLLTRERVDTTGYDPVSLWPESLAQLDRLPAVGKGVPTRLVLLPDTANLGPLVTRWRAEGRAFHDLSALYGAFKPEEFRASPWDPHPSAAVHRAIGQRLADELMPILSAGGEHPSSATVPGP